jgi:hypothetical protein
MNYKKCSQCLQSKLLSEFHKDKSTKDGYKQACKQCRGKWAENNRDRKRELQRKWDKSHRAQRLAIEKRWKKNNPEAAKAKGKRSRVIARKNPKRKVRNSISTGIYLSLRGVKAWRHWGDLVGYNINQLKHHLEKQFKPGMTWENYGTDWEIDHKIPVSAFNFEKAEDIDFKRCWDLNNLQPLWKADNRKKSAKIKQPFQPALAMVA